MTALRSLLLAFGIYGLLVWPATGVLGYDLIAGEIEMLDGIRLNASTILGRDFVNIWHGGREALGGGEAIYDREAYRATLFAAAGVFGVYAFSYPPHMLMLAIPFGVPPYLVSLLIWTIAGVTLFALAARPWLREAGLPGWAALLLPGAVVNVWAAHFGFFVGALGLFGWRWADRSPGKAGAAFALMTVKPHMGLLVPPILALKGRWRVIAVAALGFGALVLASVFVFGADVWATWTRSTLAFQAGLIEDVPRSQYSFMMPTVGRMLRAMTLDRAALLAGQIAFAFAAIGLIGWAARRGASIGALGLLSLPATVLILPYSFNYDMVALSLAALLWAARSPARWWSPERLAYAAAFVAPLAQEPLARLGWWLSPLAMLAALAFAARRAAT